MTTTPARLPRALVLHADPGTLRGVRRSLEARRFTVLSAGDGGGGLGLLLDELLDLDVLVFAPVKFARGTRQSLAQFESAIRALPEVQECFMLMGEWDFLLKVVTRDVAGYETFLREKLSVLPAVQAVHSSIALTPVKDSTALPLELAVGAGGRG